MTTPTPGQPLSEADVSLLQPGDWLRRRDGRISVYGFAHEGGLSGTYLDGTTHANSPPSHFTYLGRPDQDGWIAHEGGDNPVPGTLVDYRTNNGHVGNGWHANNLGWTDEYSLNIITHFRPHAPVSRPASEQPVEAIGAGREEEIPERAEGRLAERPWRVGDPLPAVGSVVLVSGVHGDIESDQHRGYLRRTVIGYGKDNAFICLQTEGCWPTVERTTNCWFAALSPASPARTPMGGRVDGHGGVTWPAASADLASEEGLESIDALVDMARVGVNLMERLPEGYDYSDCPTEIVTDLQNKLDEAKTPMGREVEALLRKALEPFARAAGKLDGLWDEEDWRWNDSVCSNVTVRDLRRAAQALAASSPSPAQGGIAAPPSVQPVEGK